MHKKKETEILNYSIPFGKCNGTPWLHEQSILETGVNLTVISGYSANDKAKKESNKNNKKKPKLKQTHHEK